MADGRHPRTVSIGRRRYAALPLHVMYLFAGIFGGIFFVSFCKNTFFNCGIMQARGLCCFVSLDRHIHYKRTTATEATISAHKSSSPRRIDEEQNIRDILTRIRGSHNSRGKHKKFLLVGVMTARQYIRTRVAAAKRTWIPTIPGDVVFFSSEGTPPYSNFSIIPLADVDDSYPPQKKSFSMLKFIHDHFIDEYEWFMRVDDDIYIRGDQIARFLHSVNSSKPQFIGQAGTGTKEELGQLSLNEDENYCMGGPGVVFSRATLRKVALNADACLNGVESTHEDVEVGRCVRKHAGIPCTWAYEMQYLFFHNYAEEKGSFSYQLNTDDIIRALTLHPIKKAPYLFRIHNYINTLSIHTKTQKRVLLEREVTLMNKILGSDDSRISIHTRNLGINPSFMKYIPNSRENVLIWNYMTKSSVYSHLFNNPHITANNELRSWLNDTVRDVLKIVNRNSRQRGRTIDYANVNHLDYRVNAFHGVDYMLDTLLIYHKHKGRKLTVPIRRRLHLHQVFMDPQVLPFGLDTTPSNSPSVLYANVGKDERIHFIVPLIGRYKTFIQFMTTFESVCLKPQLNVELRIVLYKSNDSSYRNTLNLAKKFQTLYPEMTIKIIQLRGSFSRGASLELGMSALHINSLMFFIDIDMNFNKDVLMRIRRNTIQGKLVYFPIVFSQYDPQTVPGCSAHSCPRDSFRDVQGSWRRYGFGIASLYKSDFKRVGGFNKTLQGWGKEDVELYEKFIASNMTVVRANDPGLVHMYHEVHCDPATSTYRMCLQSHASGYASQSHLADMIRNTPTIGQRRKVKGKL